MSDSNCDLHESLPLELAREMNRICDAFAAELNAGHEPRIEYYLGQIAAAGRAGLGPDGGRLRRQPARARGTSR
jgi:hypothetical protein